MAVWTSIANAVFSYSVDDAPKTQRCDESDCHHAAHHRGGILHCTSFLWNFPVDHVVDVHVVAEENALAEESTQ